MNRKVIFIALGGLVGFLLLMFGLFAAFGGGNKQKEAPKEDKDITLTYWRLFDDKEKLEPIFAEFKKENPKVNIEYKKLTFQEYEKTLVESLAGGRGPDLFSVHNTWLPKFQDKIGPAPEDMSVDDYKKAFFPLVFEETVKDNRIVSIPLSMDSLALFYNSDALSKAEIDQPPASWEDLVGRAKDPTRPGDEGNPGMLTKLNNRQGNAFNQSAIALGNAQVTRAQDILSLMMLQQGTEMVNQDRDKALYNLIQKTDQDKEVHLGTEALNFYTSFADPRKTNYSWNAQIGDTVRAFSQGKTTMMLGYSYHLPTLERLNPNLRFNIAPAPQIGGRDPINYGSYWTEVVSKTSPNQEAAWKLLSFMSSKNFVKDYNDATQTVPARRDVSAPGKLEVFFGQNETAKNWYRGEYDKSEQIFLDMISQLLGGEDPQRAIDNAANKQTSVLKAFKGES